MNEPYLSIVVAARNDDHGGNLLGRMQCFVNALLDQCRELDFAAELIIVEWNPPPDRPRLAEALRWNASPCQVRIIEAPETLHRRYKHAAVLPLYQMIAKNVGIRRARGAFVLATNIDILLSNELMRLAARRELQKGRMYRIDRLDVDPYPPIDGPVEARLEFCARHVIRVNAREGSIALDRDGCYRPEEPDVFEGVRLVRGWYLREMLRGEAFRWASRRATIAAPQEARGMLALEVEPGPGSRWGAFDLELEGSGKVTVKGRCVVRFPLHSPRVVLRAHGPEYLLAKEPRALRYKLFRCWMEDRPVAAPSVERRERLVPWMVRKAAGIRARLTGDPALEKPGPHTTACGDFTLMAREHWERLHGYAEFDLYSLHIDSLGCWAALSLGLEEVVLEDPFRAYHIEHGIASGWTPEGENTLFERLRKMGLPWISIPELIETIGRIRRGGEPTVFAGDDWGLPSEQLRETRIG